MKRFKILPYLFASTLLMGFYGCGDDKVDACYLSENRMTINKSGELLLPDAREELWTPEAEKNCHAKMTLAIWYPTVVRVYKTGDRPFIINDGEDIDITEHLWYEFGVPFGYFPAQHQVERGSANWNGHPIYALRFTSSVDQGARNFPGDVVPYIVEFSLRNSLRESEEYQRLLNHQLTEEEFGEKFAEIIDMDDVENLEDESSFFRMSIPGNYFMEISYTIPLGKDN